MFFELVSVGEVSVHCFGHSMAIFDGLVANTYLAVIDGPAMVLATCLYFVAAYVLLVLFIQQKWNRIWFPHMVLVK